MNFKYTNSDFFGYTDIKSMPIVYVLNAGNFNFLKIGMTNNIEKRIYSIKCGCPYEVKVHLIANVPNPKYVEKILHRYFKEFRSRGEWYSLGKEEIEEIELIFKNINDDISRYFNIRGDEDIYEIFKDDL